MSLARCLVLLLCFLAAPISLLADIQIINFETFPDSSVIPDGSGITTQFPGLTFSNATVISAGISLNEFEFPPRSGTNVAFDDSGPMSIFFSTPVLSFGGYFTYGKPLTLSAFNSGQTRVSSAVSIFSNNEGLSGDFASSPNEFLLVSSASGISKVTIAGDPSGGSFTLDDATIDVAPEPSGLIWLVAIVFGVLVVYKRARGNKTLPTSVTPSSSE